MANTDDKQEMNRRHFLGNMLKTACGVGLVGMGLGIDSNRASSLPANYIRPPGALPEEDFLGACTGCGLCERACILEEAAIKVFPTHLAKGELGKHYRLGWKEKERAGKALVTPDIEHRYNLPEGVQYDLQGDGLIIKEKVEETPFSSNPLDTLNSGFMDKQ